MAYTRAQFIEKIAPMAKKDMEQTGILASLTIAQACLESANGNSSLTVECNNLFGIKGTYNGASGTYRTAEYKQDGSKYYIDAAFRKYPSWKESIADHSSLFNRLDRYKNLRGEIDIRKACYNVQSDGYATDPKYPELLLSIVNTFNLTKYDKKVASEDGELSSAVSKVIKMGKKKIDFNSWKRIDLMELKNVPGLIDKLGGLYEINKLITSKGMTFDLKGWETALKQNKFKLQSVRSLLIKYASCLA